MIRYYYDLIVLKLKSFFADSVRKRHSLGKSVSNSSAIAGSSNSSSSPPSSLSSSLPLITPSSTVVSFYRSSKWAFAGHKFLSFFSICLYFYLFIFCKRFFYRASSISVPVDVTSIVVFVFFVYI
jgi:hypothetical protein